ncbi:DNA modification methylase [Fusobacterium gastrosuis]|uniref:DNA modification methylase n=1 Tax=Fusobacterium gastrosuis TaxID=1755100 RepID=UPI0029778D70|nr:DNA modification methylase [Fusobacteriaceae bacterium]MDY5713652.1 DNA modification methylase [Fusobacterium gastrosuis]
MVKKINLDLLKEFPNNPRVITQKQIEVYKNLLERFGAVIPTIVDSDNYVLSDYAKVEAARQLNLKEIDCILVNNLTEDEKQAIRIGEIRAIELGEWDYQKLFEELSKIGEQINLTGFDIDEIESLLPAEILDTNKIEEIDIPEVTESHFTKSQDIYLLGRHRLMCGDSTNLEDVKRLVDGKTIDLMVTDPPYNVNYQAANGNKIQNDNMSPENFYQFLLAFYKNAYEVMRTGAAFYIFHADSETQAFRGALKEAGLKISQCLIWVKNQFILSRQDYNWKHEPCLYGWKEGTAHYFIKDFTQDTVLEDSLKNLEGYSKKELLDIIKKIIGEHETIIRENKPLKNDVHPTMKPIKLIARLIHNSSKKDWNILDLFGGSGSTLIAAEQLERNSYLMEYDPKYADVIVRRYASLEKTDIKLIRENKEYSWEEIKHELISEE